MFSRQIYLDYVTYLSQKCTGHLTYLTIVGKRLDPYQTDHIVHHLPTASSTNGLFCLFRPDIQIVCIKETLSIHLFVCLNNDDNNNNNKTGQVELSARQVNYYYFKIILVGGACPFIRKAGVLGKNTVLKTLYPWQFLCSGVAGGCK